MAPFSPAFMLAHSLFVVVATIALVDKDDFDVLWRIAHWLRDRLPGRHWYLNHLQGCAVCFGGSFALWTGLALSLPHLVKDPQDILYVLVSSIAGGALNALPRWYVEQERFVASTMPMSVYVSGGFGSDDEEG